MVGKGRVVWIEYFTMMCCSLGPWPSVFIVLETAEGALFLSKKIFVTTSLPRSVCGLSLWPMVKWLGLLLTKWWLCRNRHDRYNARNQILRVYDFNSWFNVSTKHSCRIYSQMLKIKLLYTEKISGLFSLHIICNKWVIFRSVRMGMYTWMWIPEHVIISQQHVFSIPLI